jgi:hypothetical protein
MNDHDININSSDRLLRLAIVALLLLSVGNVVIALESLTRL